MGYPFFLARAATLRGALLIWFFARDLLCAYADANAVRFAIWFEVAISGNRC